MRLLLLLSSLAPVAACAGRPARPALPPGPLDRIAARVNATGATVGLYYRDLDTGDSLAYAADRRYHAASTMKVPVMVQVFRDLTERDGLTILLIEHVMRAVMALARHMVVLTFGQIIASGAPADVVRDPAVLGCYLGEDAEV